MQIITSKPRCLWKAKTSLGEGIIWVSQQNSIYFTDINKKKIFQFNIKTKKKKIIKLNKKIGFLSHLKKNIFVLGLKDELRISDIVSKKIFKSIAVEKQFPFNRINDGKTGLDGNLWFGTLDDSGDKKPTGSLYVVKKSGKILKIDQNYITTNGPAFIKHNYFYHNDSSKKIIYKIKVNKQFKKIKKNIFIKFKSSFGSPDGMTLDKKNNLWVCFYRGGCIRVFNTRGKQIHLIKFPTKNITNCIFGSKQNSKLYVITAVGNLYEIKTNVMGNPTPRLNLSF